MSFAGLLQHTVDVYRATEGADLIGSVDRSWSSSGRTGQKAAVQVKTEIFADTNGAGERVVGTYRIYMLVGADVQEGDILAVASGPGSFDYLYAQQVYRPRGHHTEITATDTQEDPRA